MWAHTGKKREYLINYEEIKNTDYPEDNLKKEGKQMRTIWDIPNNKKSEELAYGKHPTQKPIRLINRILDVSAGTDSKILIPFAGSGTECVAANQRGLDFLAYEIDDEYINIANKRLEKQK